MTILVSCTRSHRFWHASICWITCHALSLSLSMVLWCKFLAGSVSEYFYLNRPNVIMFTQGFYSDICWVGGIAHLSTYKYAKHGVQMTAKYGHVILNKHTERLQTLEHIEICKNSDLLPCHMDPSFEEEIVLGHHFLTRVYKSFALLSRIQSQ